MIRNLPPPPSRDRPNEFSGEMDAFLAALPDFVADANALEQSLQVVATTGTSTTSLTVGLGSKSLTTQPGKAWATGAWVYIFAAAAVSNYMVGRVTSYDSATGALVVNVSAIDGSGTHASWVIGLATPVADAHLVPRDGSRAMTGALTLPGNAVSALEAVPKQQLDTGLAARAALAGSGSQQFSVANASASAHAVALGQFGASIAANGYQMLPSGLIIQWGLSGAVEPAAGGSVTFPIAFPNGCLAVTTGSRFGAATAVTQIVPSATGFTFYADEWSAVGNVGSVSWIAIGW